MYNYNDEKNPISIINGIPFRFLSFRGNAGLFRIGKSRQLVYIPRQYLEKDGKVKKNLNLDWWFNKLSIQHKIKLYKEEVEKC